MTILPTRFRALPALVLLCFLAVPTIRADDRSPIAPAGEQLARFLDSLDVEHHWLAHNRVNWETGDPIGPSRDPAHSTHCSAFVAATCERLGVTILHPPEHPQKLLSNAQYDWLRDQGPSHGWRPVATAAEAQALANRGELVVATLKNPDAEHPGHIVVVRPSAKSAGEIVADGPDIIQAGGHNRRRTSVRHGFASHHGAFEEGQIAYYSHTVEAAKLAPQ